MATRFATAHFLGFERLLPIKSSTLEKKCNSNVRARKTDRSNGQSSSSTTNLSSAISVKTILQLNIRTLESTLTQLKRILTQHRKFIL